MVDPRYSSMVSPESETLPNSLVLVVHGASGQVRRLEEMKISPFRFTYALVPFNSR